MANFDANRFKREMQAAQRKAMVDAQRQVDAINRKNQQIVDEHNRKARAHNQRVIDGMNRQIRAHNQDVQRTNAHNAQVVGDLQKALRSASSPVRYTPAEQGLADRVQEALVSQDPREFDVFLSHAKIDGAAKAGELTGALEALGVRVWFDEVAIRPGQSQSLQMDQGLRKARAGVVLLTPAYLVGRFWTERELGALLNKRTLIPVLHNCTFEQVAEYSGILPDLAGFETARDSIDDIAEKIAGAVLLPEQLPEDENDD